MLRLSVSLFALVALGCASADTPRLGGDGGTSSTTSDACVPVAEKCNELDDDCNDLIDEPFDNDKGMPCTAGVGGCQRDGVYECAANGGDLECSVTAGSPGTESCDGIDDDCDMKVDEDFMYGQPCDGPDADVCMDGVYVCNGPGAALCNDSPANDPERCDAFDNDCDGMTDEGFNVGMPCDGADTDSCVEGMIICNALGAAVCSDVSTSTPERCNGLDDDCRNGVDDTYNVGTSCTPGLGGCQRTGMMVCNAAMTATMCSVMAGTPSPEICGNGVDEDCTGADVVCPPNDLASGAIDISSGGTFTADLAFANDNNFAPSAAGFDCGDPGGRDVFYQFTLPAPEVVYFDTLASNFDSVMRLYPGSCTALGALLRCDDDDCSSTRSQGAMALNSGTYCLVVDQFAAAATVGSSVLVFKRGGRTAVELPSISGSTSGTTADKTNLSMPSCEAVTTAPDSAHFFTTCSTKSVSANTCAGTAFDTVLYLRSGNANGNDVSCDDDTGCAVGTLSVISGATVGGPNLHFLIVDGFSTAAGPYTLTYSIQ